VTRLAALLILSAVLQSPAPAEVRFEAADLQRDWGVVYAVRIADINADGRPDVVAINPSQLAWFENPTWQRHLILDGLVPRDHVTIAPFDVNADGRVEIALGAGWNPRNTASGGTLHLATRTTPDGRAAWTVTALGEEPTLHRIRWARRADGRPTLVVTPLHGRGTSPPGWEGVGARVFALTPPTGPGPKESWQAETIDSTRHILHNFLVADFDGRPGDELVTASREGLTLFTRSPTGAWTGRLLAEGAPGEVVLGRIGGRRLFATIEPWHGTSVVLYREEGDRWSRSVIDDGITGGHALAWADFDGDGDDELVAGWRDGAYGIARYSIDASGRRTGKQMIDTGVAAEDLVVADLDGNGRPDIVAGGRATGNVRVFFNRHQRQ
jgi:FG-GAP-like repeat